MTVGETPQRRRALEKAHRLDRVQRKQTLCTNTQLLSRLKEYRYADRLKNSGLTLAYLAFICVNGYGALYLEWAERSSPMIGHFTQATNCRAQSRRLFQV
ncbi:hypothetical protein Y032_0600g489 [Ancylostoma ceylanicum]|uniref:Uncharacterized protein n=1 Tax=Ancylostoma ceylanicum TaxID=53326 RepID=A0A016WLL8_9BILA|nr:hypothetical protein Y032_0600g489 [Ancylostoma ceylanicum]